MIGAVLPVYNEEAIVGAVVKCFKPFVDKFIVLISEKPWFGEIEPPDRTEEICRDLDVDIIKGDWRHYHKQRNLGNQLCSDCDLVFTIDSDELMEPQEIEKMIRFAENPNHRAIGVLPEVYWKDLDHVFTPKPTFQPIMLVRPDVRFIESRNVDCPYVVCDAQMHHLAWCDLRNMKQKIKSWGHANLYTPENGERWYEHFLNWKEGEVAKDLLDNKFNVERKSLPKELRDKLGVV
uniref:Putative glycosyltransferase n=1 Tax=viral metagenome TaxID=1070528 RepID=A0A6M3IPV2_9ZZZZ